MCRWIVFIAVSTACVDTTEDLGALDAKGTDAGSAGDSGGGDGSVPSPPPFDAVVVKRWTINQPFLLTDIATEPLALGPDRLGPYGGGEGRLIYLGPVDGGALIALDGLDGQMRLARLALRADAVPEVRAVLAAPNRTPPQVAIGGSRDRVAYYDDGALFAIDLAASPAAPLRLGDWGDGLAPDRLSWSSDGRFVVASDRDNNNSAFPVDGTPPFALAAGWIMGFGAGSEAYVRSADQTTIRVNIADGSAVTLTDSSAGARTWVGTVGDDEILFFDHRTVSRFAQRLGVVSRAGGPVRWLSAEDEDADGAFIAGREVFYVEGTSALGYRLRRRAIDGRTEPQSVSVRLQEGPRLRLMGHDARFAYGCMGDAPLYRVPLTRTDAAWVAYPALPGTSGRGDGCAWSGQTGDHVVFFVPGSPSGIFRVPKEGGPPEQVDMETVTPLPGGILGFRTVQSAQLVQVGPAGSAGGPVFEGDVARRPNGKTEAHIADGGLGVIIRTAAPSSRWQWQSVDGEPPRWLSPPEFGGTLLAVDEPWVIVHRPDADPPDVRVLHLDGRFASVAPEPRLRFASKVEYLPAARHLVGMVNGTVLSGALEADRSFAVAFDAIGIEPHPNGNDLFVATADRIFEILDGERRRLIAVDLVGLGAALSTSADGEWIYAVDLSLPTAIPRAAGVWAVKRDGSALNRFAALPLLNPQDGFDTRVVPPTGSWLLTHDGETFRSSFDGQDRGPSIVGGGPPASVIYGPDGRWFAAASTNRDVLYTLTVGGALRSSSGSDLNTIALVAATDDAVIISSIAPLSGQAQLRWVDIEGAARTFPVALTPPDVPWSRDGDNAPSPVILWPDQNGIVYVSRGRGDHSLFMVDRRGGPPVPLTAVDDAEETFVGFLP